MPIATVKLLGVDSAYTLVFIQSFYKKLFWIYPRYILEELFIQNKEIELETTQNNDYALWDVIENGNSFTPVPRTTSNADGTSTSSTPGLVTTKEKTQKKNDVKSRSLLLISLPNKDLLTFNQYKDAKTLFEAIKTRFIGNDATKKTQKTLLKQLYENFNAPSIKSLDSIFNRLQKIRNKPDLNTISFDDLNKNFKIVKQEVKRTVTSSSNSSSQNMAFVSTPGSTNEADTTNVQVSTGSTPVSATNVQVSTGSTPVSATNVQVSTGSTPVMLLCMLFCPTNQMGLNLCMKN
ncbi:hypothetical protein Tco_0477330 [Tanacetum coccineum]